MKEVTEWDNNPREMWVWNHDTSCVRKAFVIWIKKSSNTIFKVVAVDEHGNIPTYIHCAEIEPSRRLMTNKELSRWLREKPNREWKDTSFVHADLIYRECEEDTEVSNDIYVREGDSPWFVPFAEEE